MAELSLDSVKAAFAECNGNILKIRKYIRDNQASLQGYSTNQLNKLVKDFLPAGMLLKRNYGHLALRSVGKTKEPEPKETKSRKPPKRQVQEEEYEEEEDDDDAGPPPQGQYQQYYEQPQYQPQYQQPYEAFNPNMLSNADIARQCFLPAAARYRNRTW